VDCFKDYTEYQTLRCWNGRFLTFEKDCIFIIPTFSPEFNLLLDNRSTIDYSVHMNAVSDISAQREHILEVAQAIIGKKGYAAVGLTEILTEAKVPKGSFYYYFKSKDAFGEALLKHYFDGYLAEMDNILSTSGKTNAERLMSYWLHWQNVQESFDCQGKCLAVKLGAEVSDLSEAMRLALNSGTAGIISRLAKTIKEGIADRSLGVKSDAGELAHTLYQLWLGASLMAKITRDKAPLKNAMGATKAILNLR
jgi:TetR/AcrR family transcriptional regulator, transcriptional repressor for nem operon